MILTIFTLSACTGIGVPPVDAGEINTVRFTHDGKAINGETILDMAEVKFNNYCGIISGTYILGPIEVPVSIIVPNTPMEFSINITGADGAYWCAMTAYNINNPINTESPYSSEYVVFKIGEKYYNSETYKNPFGIQTVKK